MFLHWYHWKLVVIKNDGSANQIATHWNKCRTINNDSTIAVEYDIRKY